MGYVSFVSDTRDINLRDGLISSVKPSWIPAIAFSRSRLGCRLCRRRYWGKTVAMHSSPCPTHLRVPVILTGPQSMRVNLFEPPALNCPFQAHFHLRSCWRSGCADCLKDHVILSTAHPVARNHHVLICVSASVRRDRCRVLVGGM